MSGSSGGYCPICEKSYPEADRCPVDGFLFQSRDALRPGVVIDGSCKILRRLGAGGMGETYLVRHAFLGENLVLKRIRPELAEDLQYQQSFLREVHSLAALRREPGVVEIRNAWQTREGYLALLLEYVEGGNLLQWLDTARGGGPLEVLEAVSIAVDLAKALAAAHAIGVLHRDVKPQNILMRRLEGGGFQLKLCDFGLAVQRIEEMTRQGATTARLGTPGYAAPEQYTLSSREQDARVDVFGLGMTLYRLAAGRLPWEASAASWPLVCTEQPRKSLKELRPALGRESWLESLLLRMTAVERDDRIATAAEALELMQEALAETRPAPAASVSPEPLVPPPPVELPQSAPPPPEMSAPPPTGGSSAASTPSPETPVPPRVELRHRPRVVFAYETSVPPQVELRQRPPPPEIPEAAPNGREVPGETAAVPRRTAIELPFRRSRAEPNGPSKRGIALAACGFVVIAAMLVWWAARQEPKDVPGNPPAQVEQGKQAPAESPPAAPEIFDQVALRNSVVGAVRARDWSKAGRLIDDLLVKVPADAEALEWRKLLSEGRKLELFAKLNPKREEPIGPEVARAEQLLQQGKYPAAIALFQRVLARDPGNTRARNGLKQAMGAKATEDRVFERGR